MNLRILCSLMLLASTALAQPVISAGGVYNSANYTPAGFANSGVAQGSLFLIFGTGLGPAAVVQATSFPLPKQLGGTSVKVTVGGTSVDAIMAYTLATQVAAILPSTTPVGDGTVAVTYNGETSASAPITVVKSAFGIYALNQGGSGPGVFTDPNFQPNSRQSSQPITVLNSAKPGDLLFIWGTGLGPVMEDETAKAPTVANLPVDVKVYVGGKEAAVSYKGRSGCCVGLDQILFTVPQGVEGCYVPVAVSVDGVVSNFTSISVSSQNRICTDPFGFTSAQLQQLASGRPLKVGQINLQRIGSDITAFGLTIPVRQDSGTATFYNLDQRTLLTTRGLSSIAAFGSCTVLTCRGASCIPDSDTLPTAMLDAGSSITINGPGGSKDMNKNDAGVYAGVFSDIQAALSGGQGYLNPGTYTATGKGGKDAGAFTANLTLPANATWTNKAAISSIDRGTPLNVTWSGGGSNDYVAVFGSSTSKVNNTSTFICTEKASVGQLTVPAWVLSALPASGSISQSGITVPAGFLLLGIYASPATFTAPGLDVGYFSRSIAEGKNVTFQ